MRIRLQDDHYGHAEQHRPTDELQLEGEPALQSHVEDLGSGTGLQDPKRVGHCFGPLAEGPEVLPSLQALQQMCHHGAVQDGDHPGRIGGHGAVGRSQPPHEQSQEPRHWGQGRGGDHDGRQRGAERRHAAEGLALGGTLD